MAQTEPVEPRRHEDRGGDESLSPATRLKSLENLAERLLTLPRPERPQHERPALEALLHAVQERAGSTEVAPPARKAALQLRTALTEIIERGAPATERQFLRLIRLLGAAGCWALGPVNEAREAGRRHEGSAKTILVVDDDLHTAKVLGTHLVQKGYSVHTAGGGKDALEWLASNAPGLVILDLVMPVMSGLGVCRWIRANPATRDIPVVFLSARNGEREVAEAMKAGGNAYVAKSMPAGRLFGIVQRFLPAR